MDEKQVFTHIISDQKIWEDGERVLLWYWSREEDCTHSAIEKKKMEWPARKEGEGGPSSGIPSQEKKSEDEGAFPPWRFGGKGRKEKKKAEGVQWLV